MSERIDAVVVGSGPNGLAAALTLAEAGRRVVLYEARDELGGGTRTAELTLPGFHSDLCSAIHPLAAGSPFFRRLRLDTLGLEWVQPEFPLAHPLDGDRAAVLERDLEATAHGLARDGRAWRRVFEYGSRRWQELADDILAPPHFPRHPLLLARFGLDALRPAAGMARTAFKEEPARALFAGLAAHSMLPLDRRGSAAFALVLGFAGHALGWPFPRGGSCAITRAMANRFTELGGELRLGVELRAIRELPESDVVLLDLGPHALARIAEHELPSRYLRALRRYRYGAGVFKLDWALSEPIPWRAEACRRAGTVHVGGGLEEIAAGEFDVSAGRHPERPFVLVAQQSLFDPTRAPAGRQVAWGYCHVPHASTADMTERIEQQIERFAPGFRDLILARHSIRPADLERMNPNFVGGDINGGSAELGQLIFRPFFRLAPYTTPNPRLFLCSASTPPGGGVHGMCGYHAARAALRRFR